jgi:DNA ligase (NAD+)
MEDKKKRMRELVELLNRARRAYEQENTEIMSNYEYDQLYDELQGLEQELNTTLASSPTINVGYEVLSELPKERHERPMLSLDKTKDVERLKEFLGDQKAMISWKLDGLTIVLTYRNGELEKAVTRGNGEVGEVITNNAKVFKNIPLRIPYTGELVLRGEAVIGYKDFAKINDEIEDVDARYKNPRNLCSGSVRQLNNKITAQRNVRFYAFTLVTTCVFQATGKAVGAFVLSISGQGVIYGLVIWALSSIWGYDGVIVTQPVADVLTCLLAVVLYFTSLHRAIRKGVAEQREP